jgi:hypothetical protein
MSATPTLGDTDRRQHLLLQSARSFLQKPFSGRISRSRNRDPQVAACSHPIVTPRWSDRRTPDAQGHLASGRNSQHPAREDRPVNGRINQVFDRTRLLIESMESPADVH